jgi:putative transposase
MNRTDEIFTAYPFLGNRRLRFFLGLEGWEVGRDWMRTIMQKLGIEAICPKRSLSKPDKNHHIYPYLLKGVEITRSNQVWSSDITYIWLGCGFAYLMAIIDWYSRRVLSWRLSNTLDADFCIEALKESLVRHGKPDIFNTDQGAQFTSDDFVGTLLAAGVKISMDGKGRALDNVFVERLWRSVKYEDIYLHGYCTIPEVKAGLERYFVFYNTIRPHQSLGYKTPERVYFENMAATLALCA